MQLTLPSANPPSNEPFPQELCSFIESVLEHFHVPGICVGIVDGSKTHIKCFGSSAPFGEPTTEDTLYYIASVTKSFTATTLLGVLDELDPNRGITLDTKISSILPDDFVLADEYATKHATLGDALAHVLGVTSTNGSYGGKGYMLRDAVRSLRHLEMNHELRQKHEYLNMGYMVIQHVVETLTGEPIEVAHRRHIWGPLDMSSTFPSLEEAQASLNTLAKGTEWNPVTERVQETAYARDYPLIGGGGLISSIKDLTAYLNAVVHGELPISKAAQEELFKPRCITNTKVADSYTSNSLYCAGWSTNHLHSQRVVQHNGGIDGFSSQLIFLPEWKWGLALLTNSGNNGYAVVQNVMGRLMDDIFRVKHEDRITKYDTWLDTTKERYLTTRQRLYPSVPEPPLPLSLPLSAYAGTYTHPAYRTIELVVADANRDFLYAARTKQVLRADVDRLCHMVVDLEHVSGDFFLAWVDNKEPCFANAGGVTARFTLGSDGAVEKWGIDIEANGRLVWFDRVK